ncbi:MAG: Na/Pi cotransporter family protein [Clostridia bacterium]|nr:Na/Pi cotransporter family protein [Clostridia bacterium]
MNISSIFSLLCGVSLFLYGMSLMGDSLKKVAGNKLETILYRLTSTPMKGVLLGMIVTAVIQSSSATTVMVVGFVNSGMMKVAQAIGIIMGANIGTSITGWILCLSYIDGSSGIARLLSTATISAVIAVIGIIIKMTAKKRVHRSFGDIMLGFAILMTGMQMMSGAVEPLKGNENFVKILTMLSNPVTGILAGIAMTVVLQSASASVGVLQALSATGNISFAIALPITMGIGVGAAFPVLLSAVGTNKEGKRTALVYLLNDLFGMILWSVVFYSVNHFVKFTFMDMIMTPVSVALVNTLFRLATVCALLPCISLIEKLVCFIIKDNPEDAEEQADFSLLEDRFLSYPALAVPQAQQVMNDVAFKSQRAVCRSLSLLTHYDEDSFKKVQTTEALVDKYEDKIGTYLIRLSARKMTPAQNKKVTKYLYTISDFESLSDYALNIAFVGDEVYENKVEFSESAQEDLEVLKAAVLEMVNLVVESFVEEDVDKVKRVEPLREYINILCDDMRDNHIERLGRGICVQPNGILFDDILTNVERLGAHCSNIAVAMTKMETHNYDYIQHQHGKMKERDEDYMKYFTEYQQKYILATPAV